MRSMMGEFGGFAYRVSAWFDEHTAKWRFEVSHCQARVQHPWWAAHLLPVASTLMNTIACFDSFNDWQDTIIRVTHKRPSRRQRLHA
jgi:hypothetical protein